MASTPSKTDSAKTAATTAPEADPAPVAKAAPVSPAVKAPESKAAKPVVASAKQSAARKPVARKSAVAKPAATPAKIVRPATQPIAPKAKMLIKKEVTTMEATIKNAADKTQAYIADAQDRAKGAWEKSQKVAEDMAAFNKGNVDAMVESGRLAAKGLESLGQGAADYNRRQFEAATAALKSLSSVKSPTDFFKLHSDYVRSSFDSIVAETSKNTEAMLKLAGEIAQPIQNRVAVAVEKIKVAA